MRKVKMSESKTILIVDDMPKNIQVAMNILRDEGYKMLFAQSGKKAFEMLDENDIDLILLDVMMPELDGFEVCKVLKQDEKTKDIPIIFLSGKDSSSDIERAYEIGGSDYVVKPFINIELIKKVHTHITLKKLYERVKDG
jgi:putative two-component system response regulator